MSLVNAESEATIFLSYENYGTCPWTTGMPDGSYVQHILKMFLDFFKLMGRDMMIMIFKWCFIIQLDLMLNFGCTSQFEVRECKNMMIPFKQVYNSLLHILRPFLYS